MAIELTMYLMKVLTVNCDASGYLRNSYIEVKNNFINDVSFDKRYLDSGRDYSSGSSRITPSGTQKWIFTKNGGSATGANGVISFICYGSSYKIVVFFENPWSGMGGAGIRF